ncbi:MAG TPA: hypothetical protein VJU77_02420 [Chthoniobacterales bacterium]|nr:hypothetical protein [Chthoniobacterales bacterium]
MLNEKSFFAGTQKAFLLRNKDRERPTDMKFKERIEQMGATGYILLWLLGIPIPILFLFFLLRGCT